MTSLLTGAEPAPGQEVLKENPYYLRSDDRLQVRLNVGTERPRLSQMIGALRDATGLDLVVDESLGGHDPDYGVLQPSKSGFYAWQLMEMVARKDLRNGYWDKTGNGYRLKADTLAPPAAPRHSAEEASEPKAVLVAVAVSLLAVLLVLVAARRRAIRGRPTASGSDPTGARGNGSPFPAPLDKG